MSEIDDFFPDEDEQVFEAQIRAEQDEIRAEQFSKLVKALIDKDKDNESLVNYEKLFNEVCEGTTEEFREKLKGIFTASIESSAEFGREIKYVEAPYLNTEELMQLIKLTGLETVLTPYSTGDSEDDVRLVPEQYEEARQLLRLPHVVLPIDGQDPRGRNWGQCYVAEYGKAYVGPSDMPPLLRP